MDWLPERLPAPPLPPAQALIQVCSRIYIYIYIFVCVWTPESSGDGSGSSGGAPSLLSLILGPILY